jgi:flagellar hook-associated protein 3 FlgL
MLDGASSVLGEARVGVTEMRASIGNSLSQIESANERQNVKKNMLTLTVGELVDVDPYELSVRINALQARLEASYSLTARLHELTLTKYL